MGIFNNHGAGLRAFMVKKPGLVDVPLLVNFGDADAMVALSPASAGNARTKNSQGF